MLNSNLSFPDLKFVKEVTFRSWQPEGRSTAVYRLDWSRKDGIIEKEHKEWMKRNYPTADLPSENVLSEKWDQKVKNLLFALPSHYLYEIRRCASAALVERLRPLPFDTAIRDMCHGTDEAFIKTAFFLLSDCVYDDDTNYFLRDSVKVIVPNLLLCKFWHGQTGRGLIERKAEIDQLKKRLNLGSIDETDRSLVDNFIKSFEKKRDDVDSLFRKIVDKSQEGSNN